MIRLIKPYIKYTDVEEEFRGIFESGMFTNGKYREIFKEKLCGYTGAGYAFPATSATTALAACLSVLGVGRGDEVIVSDFSYPATANVVEACGAEPVFADVSPGTYNMLSSGLAQKLTQKTKAVIFVCAFGNPDGIDNIYAVCKQKKVPLIVDAACALGSKSGGVPVGAIGDLTCFSFHPRKLLTSGEGGAVTTDNEEYAARLSVKLSHGAGMIDGKTEFVTYGYNYRLPELQCVMLIKQLGYLDDVIRRRIAQQERYKGYLEPLGFTAQKHGDTVLHNMQSVVFTVPERIERDGLIDELRLRDIEATIGTYSMSACRYYQKKYNHVQEKALWLEQNTITLPCHDEVDMDLIETALKEICGEDR